MYCEKQYNIIIKYIFERGKIMNIRELAKKTKDLLEEGIAIVYFWKIKKSWNYKAFWYEEITEEKFSKEDQKEIDNILEIDKNAVGLNGYEEFGSYTLKYIEWRIKRAYQDQKEMLENNKEFEYHFNCENDPRKGIPYVAKLSIDNEGKLQREFKEMDKEWGKKNVTVSGYFKACAGQIIEQRQGGSWNNDYRYWYLVTHNGDLLKVAGIDNSREKARVKEFLKGEITVKQLKENY